MKQTASVIFRSTLLILIGIALGLFISDNGLTGRRMGLSLSGTDDKMSKVLELVQYNYVDSVNVDSITGVTVNELLQKLDPHSLYLPPQQASALSEKLEGGFTGVGIEYLLLRDTFVVTQVYAGSPAARAGLTGGCKIIDINNKKFAGTGLTDDQISKALRQDKSKPILFTAIAPGEKEAKPYLVKPGRVTLSSLDAAYIAGNNTGYIKIGKFASTTDKDFRGALNKLKAEGMKKLVLDLRGNGGGYLNTATALADEFLTKGKLIVYTKGVHEPRTDYFATDSGAFQQGKLAVLIDEYSASASEILAGALQDLDRAVIVGRRSFGKGLVQQQFPFGDGSAINLTVARYYTPSGRSIQKSYSHGVESYRRELSERMKKGELFSAENIRNDSVFSKQSPYRTSSGKQVFSGGGIMPDVFIPADTAQTTRLIQKLSSAQVFTAYIVDRMQPLLKEYPQADGFIKNYTPTDTDFNSFIQYASHSLKHIDEPEVQLSKTEIKSLLKAYAARFKWGDTYYFQAININDATLNQAIASVE
ncbi:S41 family peptidase [Mucilaginibacter gynuensis]|uniref:S41 family peptidase n=1 Tax=Mucilaginibacter gynuensis TaxID=1302236 RepID=A0ABP8H813_9SPHI